MADEWEKLIKEKLNADLKDDKIIDVLIFNMPFIFKKWNNLGFIAFSNYSLFVKFSKDREHHKTSLAKISNCEIEIKEKITQYGESKNAANQKCLIIYFSDGKKNEVLLGAGTKDAAIRFKRKLEERLSDMAFEFRQYEEKQKEKEQKEAEERTIRLTSAPRTAIVKDKSILSELKELKELLDNGFINENEFKKLKEKIVFGKNKTKQSKTSKKLKKKQ